MKITVGQIKDMIVRSAINERYRDFSGGEFDFDIDEFPIDDGTRMFGVKGTLHVDNPDAGVGWSGGVDDWAITSVSEYLENGTEASFDPDEFQMMLNSSPENTRAFNNALESEAVRGMESARDDDFAHAYRTYREGEDY